MNTKEKIIRLAKDLIQESGANAFSYQDIADELKIKKASIHYYFPTKNDLLLELLNFYSKELKSYLSEIEKNHKSNKERFKAYLAIYSDLAKSERKLCLCGILAAEILTLAPILRKEIRKFFLIHEEYLTKLFISSAVSKKEDARIKAKFVVSALQGALLVSRAQEDSSYLREVLSSLVKDSRFVS